ncbi:diaminobutyrate acetyltransferase [Oceaniserpentilla sp. 4NH20-0058]|uniref:diaminobutyrate acetyltransferase n=1 Tax=Oceaniserpentilla sp. 4NH20-0058 TaxID=3127660 RepID=UPI00310596ED
MPLAIELKVPKDTDGMLVHKLVQSCPPLDTNSAYCNLLQCTHFADTSVAAVLDEQLVGFISGYILPARPDTLFIWQVAVSDQTRGQGLASKMIQHILQRANCEQVAFIETTITESNEASWALFGSMARKLEATLERSEMFEKQAHFHGEHDSEMLVRIGPFTC